MGKNKKNKQWDKPGFPNQSKPGVASHQSMGATAPGNKPGQGPATSAPTDELETQDLNQLVETAVSDVIAAQAVTTASGADVPPPADAATDATPPAPSREELVEAIRAARDAKRRHEELRREAEASKSKSDEALQKLNSQRDELQQVESRFKEAAATQTQREKAIESERITLMALRAEAEAGFPQLLSAWRKTEEAAMQARRDELDARASDLETDRKKLGEQAQALRTRKRELEIAESELEARKENLDARIAIERQRAADEAREARAVELDELEVSIVQLKKALESQEDRANKLQEILDGAGGLSIMDLAEKKRVLSKRVDELELARANNPSPETIDAYRREAERAKSLETQVVSLESKLSQAVAELSRVKIPVAQQENYKLLVENMQINYEKLKEANRILQEDVRNQLDQSEGKRTFPEMSLMDDDSELQQPARTSGAVQSLEDLVHNVQALMANRERPLYYDCETIRCFLAGLAMSRLHILQGISGTGKTSLPIAFAEALGGRSDKIAVQAGWRERQDLLGYYNSFDKQYHETEFVKALYRAQCPQWEDRVNLVVLDEMNLSYIEQFGADLLAELESPHPEGMRLALTSAAQGGSPKLLVDGRLIRVPDNVWFIGTANRDETTKDFADKSYDRAHTMELPRHLKPSTPPVPRRDPPISARHLEDLFRKAKRDNEKPGEIAFQFIDQLSDLFAKDFGLGWGNRLERQIRDFTPVIVAAGGTPAEAVDHMLATKLLRKIEHRHNVRPESLDGLKKALAEKAAKTKGLDPKDSKSPLPKCERKLSFLISERRGNEGELG